MTTLFDFLGSRSRPFLVVTSGLVLLGLAIVDYLTGPQLRFFIFYWPPIAIVAWYVGRGWAHAIVGLSGIAWFLANAAEGLGADSIRIVAWNASVNLASFILLATLIGRLRGLVERERLTARTDYTTGVANARAFAEAVEAAAARSRRTDLPLTVAYLDLDDFKRINDRRGHAAGDELLRSIGGTLRAHLRTSDTVARLGGDEFGVLLPETGDAEASAIIERLSTALHEAERARGWGVSASIGVVTCAPGSCTVDDLIGRADELMYEAKSHEKGSSRHIVMRPGGELATAGRFDPGSAG